MPKNVSNQEMGGERGKVKEEVRDEKEITREWYIYIKKDKAIKWVKIMKKERERERAYKRKQWER